MWWGRVGSVQVSLTTPPPPSPARNFVTSPQSPISHQYKMAPVNTVHRIDWDRQLRRLIKMSKFSLQAPTRQMPFKSSDWMATRLLAGGGPERRVLARGYTPPNINTGNFPNKQHQRSYQEILRLQWWKEDRPRQVNRQPREFEKLWTTPRHLVQRLG